MLENTDRSITTNADIFIYLLSSKSTIQFDSLKDIFSQTCWAEDENNPELNFMKSFQQTMRFLDSLGFCEVDYSSRRVSMCPPYLVSIPGFGLPMAVLVGSRTPELVQALKQSVGRRKDTVGITAQENKNSNVPELIKITSMSFSTLTDVAKECGVGCMLDAPAAYKLLDFSASINEVEQRLKFQKKSEPKFESKTFSCRLLQFSKGKDAPNLPFRLVEYETPYNQRVHLLWNGDGAAEMNRDWGRYIVLNHENTNVLLYDSSRNKMAVPTAAQLPTLLARSLSLCSGAVPNQKMCNLEHTGGTYTRHYMFVYSNVPPYVAEGVAKKLGQKLTLKPFEKW